MPQLEATCEGLLASVRPLLGGAAGFDLAEYELLQQHAQEFLRRPLLPHVHPCIEKYRTLSGSMYLFMDLHV